MLKKTKKVEEASCLSPENLASFRSLPNVCAKPVRMGAERLSFSNGPRNIYMDVYRYLDKCACKPCFFRSLFVPRTRGSPLPPRPATATRRMWLLAGDLKRFRVCSSVRFFFLFVSSRNRQLAQIFRENEMGNYLFRASCRDCYFNSGLLTFRREETSAATWK